MYERERSQPRRTDAVERARRPAQGPAAVAEVILPHEDVRRQVQRRRVRRRPRAGPTRRGQRRVPRSVAVLRAHLPHRRSARAAAVGAAAHRRARRPAGHQLPDELRRRQDAQPDRPLPPVLRACRCDQLPEEVRELVGDAGVEELPAVQRAVVVGNRFAAGDSHAKPDGTVVNTIWGEIAWQLGGADGLRRSSPTATGTAPTPATPSATLFQRCAPVPGPDRRVGGLRPRAVRPRRPAGRHRSTPSSASPRRSPRRRGHATAACSWCRSRRRRAPATSDADAVGRLGPRGRRRRPGGRRSTRLTNVVIAAGRALAAGQRRRELRDRAPPAVPAARPETQSPIGTRPPRRSASCTAASAASSRPSAPSIATSSGSGRRIPIHPEVFDRLYEDWSTVERFQRTRGVLRLMAAVIHALWASDDRSPLILPCSIPLDDRRVNGELDRQARRPLGPVIDADVDGPYVPRRRRSTARCRTSARTTPPGASPARSSSAPRRTSGRPTGASRSTGSGSGRCSPASVRASFADALNRLAAQAPHLYVDRDRYWFDLQQNVNRTARDEADRLLAGDTHEVHDEIVERLASRAGRRRLPAGPRRASLRATTSPTTRMARLVVLGPEHPHIAKAERVAGAAGGPRRSSTGAATARASTATWWCSPPRPARRSKGSSSATADYLAWTSICERVDELNLDAHQTTPGRSAMAKRPTTPSTCASPRPTNGRSSRVRPTRRPGRHSTWCASTHRARSPERVSRKLVNEGTLATQFPPVMLRLQARQRASPAVGRRPRAVATCGTTSPSTSTCPACATSTCSSAAVGGGAGSLTWQSEGFAIAVGIDAAPAATSGSPPDRIRDRRLRRR